MPKDLDQYLLDTFEEALRGHYIQVYYQPVIRTLTRRACSFEALARWDDPVHGMIQPDSFIGLLESHRLIHKLDSYVIRNVCRRLRLTIDEGFYPIPVSVNLSREDFEMCDIFSVVDSHVSEFRLPHHYLHIEITESMFADNPELMRTVIDRFHAAGYQVWMDDFGSGYSSLNVLKDYTFDELKIDREFISAFHLRSRQILTSVTEMAKDLDLHTLMEGVETEAQFQFLRDIGCEKVQGYLFGEPMPYDRLIDHLRRIGVPLELPKDHVYYDKIGRVNVLSASPFMSVEQRFNLSNARELNSIPLSIVEVCPDTTRFLFYNASFENIIIKTQWGSAIIDPKARGATSTASLPRRIYTMLEETKVSGDAKLYFVSDSEYYVIQSRLIAAKDDAYSVLLRLDNLSQNTDVSRMNTLDTEMRHIYSVFDRITILELGEDRITPLYVGTHDEKVASSDGIQNAVELYAKEWIFVEDQEIFLRYYEAASMDERIAESGRSCIVDYFRTLNQHGQFSWKQYLLIRLRPSCVFSVIRDADEDVQVMRKRFLTMYPSKPRGELTHGRLWKSLIQSDIGRLYWKDDQRRYVGASKGFLDYFGLSSIRSILGKTDEEIGWHLLSDHVLHNDESVLREGAVIQNVPARFISGGVERNVRYSSTPVYNEYGHVIGLVGSLSDQESSDASRPDHADLMRHDGLTGLLNARGIDEALSVYCDMYYLRRIDFLRVHITVEDYDAITMQYGFSHGDKVLSALGAALSRLYGNDALVGRIRGYDFVLLRQYSEPQEIPQLLNRIHEAASQLGVIDGIRSELYLSVGVSTYSECEDVYRQEQLADARVQNAHNERISSEFDFSHAGKLFRVYDNLPLSFSVYELRTDPETQRIDAYYLYVNARYAIEQKKKPKDLIGRSVREVFPDLEPEWYEMAQRAAFLSQDTIVENVYYDCMKTHYRVTASQIIRQGYCAFTYQPLDGPFASRGDA